MHSSGRADYRPRGSVAVPVILFVLPLICHAQGGVITTVAGGQGGGFSGDGGPATSAKLGSPGGIAVDNAGNLYIADTGNNRIRRVNSAGNISTVAGTGSGTFTGNGGPATSGAFSLPPRVAADSNGSFYFPAGGGHFLKVNAAGIMSTFAGGGGLGYSGDGGPATSAGISQYPFGVAVDGAGNVYFSDSSFLRIRKISTSGIITTIAGTGTAGFSGDGGPGTSAQYKEVVGVAADKAGNVYIADTGNSRVRKIDTSGIITTVAGTGAAGFSGDGGPATKAQISDPNGLAVDGQGNLFIADRGNVRVRRVDPSGIITTVAGNGRTGFSADGGAATAVTLSTATDVAADADGNLYILDASRVRKVTPGSAAPPGGGGPAGPTPRITAVLDAAAYTATIAAGSVFVVKGTNLCDGGTVFGTVPYSQGPLNNVKITFTPTAKGFGTDAFMVYTFGAGATNQLAAILPSTVAPGDYVVTVTNNGSASAGFQATVVAHKFGIITVSGSGAGRAVVQNYISSTQYDLGRYTSGTLSGYTYSPAHPGQIIVIWGTGMGPITSPDNALPGAIDLRASLNIQVLIDGVAFTPDLYAGRAPTLPGADEIVLTLPSKVTTGCLVSLQVSVNGQLSNATTISIASGSDNACVAPGFTAAQLARLDQGGNFNVGTMTLAGGTDTNGNTTIRVDTAGAIFVSVNADGLAAGTPAPVTPIPDNSCVVTRQILGVPAAGGAPLPAFSFLDTGKLTLSGPNVVNAPLGIETILNANVGGVTVVNGAVLAAGTYTVTGAGGKDVGPFQATINMSQPLVVTGKITTPVLRSQPLAVSWTGGGTGPVIISGSSSVAAPGSTAANPLVDSGVFQCMTTGDKLGFTVPASVLQQLPAAKGNVTITSNSQNINFTAPMTAGGSLDAGYFSTGFSNRTSVTFN